MTEANWEWAKGLTHVELADAVELSIESKSQRGFWARREAIRRLRLLGEIGPQ